MNLRKPSQTPKTMEKTLLNCSRLFPDCIPYRTILSAWGLARKNFVG
jgi:hypothetical protein